MRSPMPVPSSQYCWPSILARTMTWLKAAALGMRTPIWRSVFAFKVLYYAFAAMRPLRKHLQLVFQDPFGSLSPRLTVEQIVGEGLQVLRDRSAGDRIRIGGGGNFHGRSSLRGMVHLTGWHGVALRDPLSREALLPRLRAAFRPTQAIKAT